MVDKGKVQRNNTTYAKLVLAPLMRELSYAKELPLLLRESIEGQFTVRPALAVVNVGLSCNPSRNIVVRSSGQSVFLMYDDTWSGRSTPTKDEMGRSDSASMNKFTHDCKNSLKAPDAPGIFGKIERNGGLLWLTIGGMAATLITAAAVAGPLGLLATFVVGGEIVGRLGEREKRKEKARRDKLLGRERLHFLARHGKLWNKEDF